MRRVNLWPRFISLSQYKGSISSSPNKLHVKQKGKEEDELQSPQNNRKSARTLSCLMSSSPLEIIAEEQIDHSDLRQSFQKSHKKDYPNYDQHHIFKDKNEILDATALDIIFPPSSTRKYNV